VAVESAVDYLLSVAPFLRAFWRDVRISVGNDSGNLLSLMRQYHPSCAEKRLIADIKRLQGKAAVIPTMALRDVINAKKIVVFKVPTKENLADALTKCMNVAALASGLCAQPISPFDLTDAYHADETDGLGLVGPGGPGGEGQQCGHWGGSLGWAERERVGPCRGTVRARGGLRRVSLRRW
jgi:hypothetical protein